jgi:hypothetical protein
MTVVYVGVIWAGYAVTSYGWILLRGWDIPFREWVSPLHPYTWPSGKQNPPTVPAGQVFPSASSVKP